MEYKNDYNNYLITSSFREDKKLSSVVSWKRKIFIATNNNYHFFEFMSQYFFLKEQVTRTYYQNKIHE